ncbi:MAG: hypothetical protein AW09_003406 [Candidatus Accumulibacter phosphatis]|jgi:hypothetical protein|uniref:Uncharacterized protein n=1 Tax=Candidatus Accumulibacter phosphatis TaxID=327160 RepID=A0A080LSQ1_9PROT|nr:MAG: hypothetical protein AW09_003406 [Candidatus Accumulibacter phosphatis]
MTTGSTRAITLLTTVFGHPAFRGAQQEIVIPSSVINDFNCRVSWDVELGA